MCSPSSAFFTPSRRTCGLNADSADSKSCFVLWGEIAGQGLAGGTVPLVHLVGVERQRDRRRAVAEPALRGLHVRAASDQQRGGGMTPAVYRLHPLDSGAAQ